jgi:uncharacterized membrane protein YhaH (DUF805 family)
MDFSHLYLSTEGRIGRQMWWIGHIILGGIGIVIMVIAVKLFGQLTFASRLISLIWILIVAYPAYAVSAKRFQDRNKNGALGAILIGISAFSALLQLFGIGVSSDPIHPSTFGMILGIAALAVAIWYLIELGILRGTVGGNDYGPDPVG